MSFSPGTVVGDTRCTSYPIIDDILTEPDEYFRVNLVALLADQVAVDTNFDTALIHITDNDCKSFLPKFLCLRQFEFAQSSI